MVLTIVPTETMRRDWERAHIDATDGVLLGPRCLTWNNFVARLADTDLPMAHNGIQRLAVACALTHTALRHFGNVREHPGTIGLFAETIALLKNGGIDPAALRTLFATRGGAAEFDLLHVYERYQTLLAAWDVIDAGDLFALACRRVRTAPPPFLHEVTRIEYIGFPEEAAGPTLLAGACGNFSQPHSGGEGGTRLALPVGGALLPPVIDIEVIAAPTPLQECRWVANYCANEIAMNGVAPEDLAIMAPADPIMRRALRAALIDAGCSVPTPIAIDALLAETLLNPRDGSDGPERQSVAAWCATWEALVHRTADPDRWARDWRARHGDATMAAALAAHSAMGAVTEQLRAMERCDASIVIASAEFQTIVRELFRSTLPAPRNEGITWFHFDELPIMPRAQIIVPGCIDGKRPSIAAPLPFCTGTEFRDTECIALRTLLPTPEDVATRAQRHWDRWRSMARNSFIATYPQSGTDGRATIPSSLLPPSETHVSVDFLKSDTYAHTHTRTYAHTHSISLTDPLITSHIAQRFRAHRFSVSQLERYAAAPFAFYCQYVLGLRPVDELTPEVKPKDRGTVIHAVLEEFWKGPIPASAELPSHVTALTDRVIATHRTHFAGTHPALIERLRVTAGRLCTRLLRQEFAARETLTAPLAPSIMEWAFGEDDIPPLTIPMPGDEPPIEIRGRIDRIDTDAERTRFIILDYKTGQKKSPKSDIGKGRHFQLPIYMMAVQQLLLPNAEPIAGLLIFTQHQAKQIGLAKKIYNDIHFQFSAREGSLCKPEEWDNLCATTVTRVQELVAMIRRAEFPAEWHDCAKWCEWKSVCGK